MERTWGEVARLASADPKFGRPVTSRAARRLHDRGIRRIVDFLIADHQLRKELIVASEHAEPR